MGSGLLLSRTILVILSTCYTNGLTLNDLYPYGTEHGDSISIFSYDATGIVRGIPCSTRQLQPPINNLVAGGFTAISYRVNIDGSLTIAADRHNYINLFVLTFSNPANNTKVYYRTTDDPGLINRAMDQINEGFPNTFCSTSPPTQLIIATWIDHLKTSSNPGSNFQAIVVTNGNITFGIALYVSVQLTSVDATGIESSVNGVYVAHDPSFFPFGTTVMDAPTMMLNSNIPGTYIFSLTNTLPYPCFEPRPDCSALCKAKLLKMTCEALRINGDSEDLPAPCNN